MVLVITPSPRIVLCLIPGEDRGGGGVRKRVKCTGGLWGLVLLRYIQARVAWCITGVSGKSDANSVRKRPRERLASLASRDQKLYSRLFPRLRSGQLIRTVPDGEVKAAGLRRK